MTVVLDTIKNALDKGDYALEIFLDVPKAFGTWDGNMRLNKLVYEELPYNGYILSNRKHSVSYKDKNSYHLDLRGSILCPLLFSIYTTVLPKVSPPISCSLFADDITFIIY